MCSDCSSKSPCRIHCKLAENNKQIHKCLRRDWKNNNLTYLPNKCVFPLDNLPLVILIHVAKQLTFSDARSLQLTSKKFSNAEKIARRTRKRLSIDILRQQFPAHYAFSRQNDSSSFREDRHGYGILELSELMRRIICNILPKSLCELDLSAFSTLNASKIIEIFGTNQARIIFKNVGILNINECILQPRELKLLSQIMPNVWCIRLYIKHFILDQENNEINKDENNILRNKIDNLDDVLFSVAKISQENSSASITANDKSIQRRALQIISLVTSLFSNITLIELS